MTPAAEGDEPLPASSLCTENHPVAGVQKKGLQKGAKTAKAYLTNCGSTWKQYLLEGHSTFGREFT
jgi:hypothetical protein